MSTPSKNTALPSAVPRRLRLLMVSADNYPPTRVDLTLLFGVELAARGHRTDLILQSAKPAAYASLQHWDAGRVWVGATNPGESLPARINKHLRGIRADMRLWRWLRTGEYDCLIVKDKFISGVAGLLASRLFGTPFLYWLSYPFPESYLERATDGTGRYPLLYRVRGLIFNLLLYRLLLPCARHVFVQSEQMRRNLAAAGVPENRMTVVPMGIDPALCGQNLTAGHDDQPTVVYLGTLSRTRQLEFILRVFARVVHAFPDARFVMVGGGDGPDDQALLEAEARRLGITSVVRFTGPLPRSDALIHVARAHVCVSPIRPSPVLNAGDPTKLIEYMAMGKAVVANDQPEQRRIIEQSGGGYCVPYDEAAFAAAVLELLRDQQLAQEMGQRGRRYVLQHRAYPTIALGVEQMLELVASAAPARVAQPI